MYSMAEQRQDDQLEPTYSSSVKIRDVSLMTYQKQCTIGRGGERESGISVLMVKHDDDDISNGIKSADNIKLNTHINLIQP